MTSAADVRRPTDRPGPAPDERILGASATPAVVGPVLAIAGAAVVIVTLVVVPRTDPFLAAHTAASAAAARADAAAGLALAGLAVLAWLMRPAQRDLMPVAAAVAAIAWTSPAWIAWTDAGPLVRSLAMLVEPLLLAALLHLSFAAAPTGHPRRRRTVETVVLAVLAAVAVGRAVVRDPFLDPFCWGNCQVNVLLVASVPTVARALDSIWLATTATVGVTITAVAGWQLTRGGPTTRRRLGAVLAPAVLVGLAYAAYGAAVLVARPERAADPLFTPLFHLRAWSVALLATGLAVMVLRSWRAQRRVAGIVAELEDAPAPGTLDRALAQATGDTTLAVLYPSPAGGRYTDAAGVPMPLTPPRSARTATSIVSGGEELAVVVHDQAVVGPAQLRRAFGPALQLALTNERLRAELLNHLDQLRRSRTRAVELGDQERRRLERNLHDGAQQQVLTLAIGLQVVRLRAEAAGESDLGELLRRAEEQAAAAVAELRELAHGIHPAVLTESGLGAALRDLAERAPLPVDIEELPEGRLPELVERVAYHCAAEAVQSAHEADRDAVRLRVRAVAGHLELEIIGAGVARLVTVEDRVDAAGGSVLRSAGTLRVELPCA